MRANLAWIIVIAAACSGSSKKQEPAPTPTPDPVPMAEPTPTPTPTPAPSEPAPPAPDPAEQKKAELLAAEKDAYEKAKPVFDKFCAKCHSKGGANATAKKLAHLDISTYPFGGEHGMGVAKEIRKVLAIGGGKASMPADKKGAVKGDDLAAIAAWADAFDASHAGGAHEGHGGGHEHH